MIEKGHAPVNFAPPIDWSLLVEASGRLYHEKERTALSMRLVVGLHLLKHRKLCPTRESAIDGSRAAIMPSRSDQDPCARLRTHCGIQNISGCDADARH